ncbi:hypothetical protein QR680_011919 [Steinernema hermaphroditum]|uniref:Fungal lipase-type domain-containing protein n=1 Tax=Steinernema hermaphroditum TaxID=289476 RepID=A0AA39I070_9BILA|nr:hypothetical protein QR680_011919 [Steinernema hermaphroditum]
MLTVDRTETDSTASFSMRCWNNSKHYGRIIPMQWCWLGSHSLGGAIATLVSSILTQEVPADQLKLITLGGPRLGDDEFVVSITKSIKQNYRVVNAGDPIPLPPWKQFGNASYEQASNRYWSA